MSEESFKLIKDSLSHHRQTATLVKQTVPTQQEVDELFHERITPETDLPSMQPLFRMFDVPCFYRGELVADCGKAKSGKTYFLSILMAACLTQKALVLERIIHTDLTDLTDLKPLRVLWIDTEQSQQSTQEILKERIIPLAEKSHTDLTDLTDICCERSNSSAQKASVRSEGSVCDINNTFYAFNLRGLGYEKRGQMVNVAIRTIKPDICIIDGIKDLMTDINDAVQATRIMEQLMALAKEFNCSIVCVLHLNKSEQDRNMRGSIGTELTNKAFEVFQCEMINEKDKTDTFKVTQTYSRKQKMKQKLYYRVNDEGLPEWCPDYQEQPRDDQGRWMSQIDATTSSVEVKSDMDLHKLFTTAMEGRNQRPFGEVMAIALKKCGVIDAMAYYHYLNLAVKQKIVHKEVHPETGATWIVLDENTLPF